MTQSRCLASIGHRREQSTRVDEMFFQTRDGTVLSARLWLPSGVALDADELRAPAVIEILPYGYATGTIDVDEATFPYLAGNGIACIRVDSRGSGNSEGVLDDEYSPQQQRDACDACEWAAAQPWCTGAVGMMGCSWGGFIALQAAALAGNTAGRRARGAKAPRRLRGVRHRRSRQRRHALDGWIVTRREPRVGRVAPRLARRTARAGDVRGIPSFSYRPARSPRETSTPRQTTPTLTNPPNPVNRSDNDQSSWESRWVSRLEGSSPCTAWASLHPESSEGKRYWKEGSVGSGGGNSIVVPVLSVGCLHGGGYRNSPRGSPRALGPNRVKAVMGSWVHNYPHLSKSGPAFGFLSEVLDFWKSTSSSRDIDAAAGIAPGEPTRRPRCEGPRAETAARRRTR